MMQKATSPSRNRQHYLFHSYLKKEKEKVRQNLIRKIYPGSDLNEYKLLKIIGYGSFGKVFAAQHLESNEIHAVKLFPLMEGGQLFYLLRKVTFFEENVAVFYASQMVLALEYLQYMGIVFRDLKPENILIDSTGYLKLIDFGFAKYIGDNYSYTFCGTPEYIAPEIWMGSGYSWSPDWWSLGILIFEMCNASPPFTSKNNYVLYEKILAAKINWPDHFSADLKSLLKGLLEVKVDKRLGCMKNKAQDVKFHKWFASVNWIALWNKKVSPPVFTLNTEPKQETYSDNLKTSLRACHVRISTADVDNIDFSI